MYSLEKGARFFLLRASFHVLGVAEARDHQNQTSYSNYQENYLWKTQRKSNGKDTLQRVIEIRANTRNKTSDQARADEGKPADHFL